MRRLILLAALAFAACGGDDKVAATPTATASPEATETATATATASAEATVAAEVTCKEVKYKPKEEEGGSGHPAANFFEPGADNLPSAADLDHLVVADNAVVVLYADDTPQEDIDRFSTWWSEDVTKRTPVVVPDDSADAMPVRARIATVELQCDGVDFERLTKFANRTDIEPSYGDHG